MQLKHKQPYPVFELGLPIQFPTAITVTLSAHRKINFENVVSTKAVAKWGVELKVSDLKNNLKVRVLFD